MSIPTPAKSASPTGDPAGAPSAPPPSGSPSGASTGPARAWLLLGDRLDQDDVTRELTTHLDAALGPDFAVVRTGSLVMGVRSGRLTLSTLTGTHVDPPEVVYARLPTPRLSADREITLLRHLRAMGALLLNPIDAVLSCVNKFWHLQQLAAAGLPVPDSVTYADAPLAAAVAASPFEPCVVKSVRGHRGDGVFLAPTVDALEDLSGCLRQEVPYLFQEYRASSHGRDLRVVVVDGRAVWSQVRTAPGRRLKANLARGGTATACPGRYPQAEDLACRAAGTLGLTVAGVDLLFLPDGAFDICEVNANVAWKAAATTVAPAVVRAVCDRLRPPAPGRPDGRAGRAAGADSGTPARR
ncbi:RimK family alpha-L-glutamate ligase [Streptomyces kanasensis]|uniref:RimK family alpha-L-glutamate ligase n=1 Tax=Streptomyces kanasensis TaxID=936756 RepID=UPI00380680B8